MADEPNLLSFTLKSHLGQKVLLRAHHYAASHWPVLIMGETGVGKELLAQFIHNHSETKNYPFVAFNASAIPSSLFESELFGFERGSFTGAQQSFKGLIRSAQGGTLFIDEIGDLDLSLQIKLLRWLDNEEVRSIGSTRSEKIRTRIISATHVDLYQAVQEKKFRLDLLERLSVLNLFVPPLRDRREDIRPIIDYWTTKTGTTIDEEGKNLLENEKWPGNVRQLKNIIIRAGVLSSPQECIKSSLLKKLVEEELNINNSSIQSYQQVPSPRGWDNKLTPPFTAAIEDAPLENIEKQVIISRLFRYHGNRKQTAKALGIAKSTLHEKLRKWKMEQTQQL